MSSISELFINTHRTNVKEKKHFKRWGRRGGDLYIYIYISKFFFSSCPLRVYYRRTLKLSSIHQFFVIFLCNLPIFKCLKYFVAPTDACENVFFYSYKINLKSIEIGIWYRNYLISRKYIKCLIYFSKNIKHNFSNQSQEKKKKKTICEYISYNGISSKDWKFYSSLCKKQFWKAWKIHFEKNFSAFMFNNTKEASLYLNWNI